MTVESWPPAGWRSSSYRSGRRDHSLYVLQPDGRPQAPSVLLLHEFPGISRHLVEFARDLATEFRVVVPSILGRDGSPSTGGSLAQLCIRREIYLLARNRTSPALSWLRGLADDVVAGAAESIYGVVGMCMTGGFALALAVDARVRAAVVAQPALPLAHIHRRVPLPSSGKRAAALSLSPQDCAALRLRAQADTDRLCVRGYRFRDDWQSPASRMDSITNLLGPEAVRTVTLTEPRPDAHSTLTGPTRNHIAVEEVVAFLRERLSA
jgi:dienelactone hydrolase